MGRIIKHVAGHRIDSNMAMDVLQDAEIILTTYGEVLRSYPKADVPEDLVTATQKVSNFNKVGVSMLTIEQDNWWREYYEENKGILHQVKFLRVVLDEAQQIKNHKTRGSMSCRALQARHYWVSRIGISSSSIDITLTSGVSAGSDWHTYPQRCFGILQPLQVPSRAAHGQLQAFQAQLLRQIRPRQSRETERLSSQAHGPTYSSGHALRCEASRATKTA